MCFHVLFQFSVMDFWIGDWGKKVPRKETGCLDDSSSGSHLFGRKMSILRMLRHEMIQFWSFNLEGFLPRDPMQFWVDFLVW